MRAAQVKELAVRAVVEVDEDTTLAECAKIMRNERVGSVIEADGAKGEGIVTDRDIVIEVVATGLDPETLTAGDIMSTPPATVRDSDDLFDALARMRERGGAGGTGQPVREDPRPSARAADRPARSIRHRHAGRDAQVQGARRSRSTPIRTGSISPTPTAGWPRTKARAWRSLPMRTRCTSSTIWRTVWARRGWLAKGDVINTRPLTELRAWPNAGQQETT